MMSTTTSKVIQFGNKSVFAANGSVVVIDERDGRRNEHTPDTGLAMAYHFAQQAGVMKVNDPDYVKWQRLRNEYLRLAQGLFDIAKEAHIQQQNNIVERPKTNAEREVCERREEMNARICEAQNGQTYKLDLSSFQVTKVEQP